MKPILYTIDGCHRCFQAWEHLMKEEIYFQEVNILHDPHAAKEIKERIGEVVVPVFIQENIVLRELDILDMKKGRE